MRRGTGLNITLALSLKYNSLRTIINIGMELLINYYRLLHFHALFKSYIESGGMAKQLSNAIWIGVL